MRVGKLHFELKSREGEAAAASPPPPAPSLRLSVSPNPTRAGADIELDLPSPGEVELAIYDAAGRRVRDLLAGRVAEGRHVIPWDGRSNRGQWTASGVYTLRLASPEGSAVQRIVRLR